MNGAIHHSRPVQEFPEARSCVGHTPSLVGSDEAAWRCRQQRLETPRWNCFKVRAFLLRIAGLEREVGENSAEEDPKGDQR